MSDELKDQMLETPVPMKWTRERYDRCVAAGIFTTEDRIELLDGEILTMSPQQTPHAVAVRLGLKALMRAFGDEYDVACQLPFVLDDNSEPEPDLVVAKGNPRDFIGSHPRRADLIVEVADTSLGIDRHRKLEAYARSGVSEYWIVNLNDKQLEVHRAPNESKSNYGDSQILMPGQSIAPLAAADRPVAVDDLLP